MGKKSGKPIKKPTAGTDEMLRAKNLFIEKLGSISDTQISRIVGVHRVTIGKWRKEGKWQEVVDEVRQAADKKAVAKTVDKIADQMSWASEEVVAICRLISFGTRKMMIQHDERGRPVLDANGQPTLNPKLSPSDYRALSSTMEAVQRAMRLEQGRSTQNTESRITGAVTTLTQEDKQFKEALQKITQSGDADGQEAIALMIEARQKIMAKAGLEDDEND